MCSRLFLPRVHTTPLFTIKNFRLFMKKMIALLCALLLVAGAHSQNRIVCDETCKIESGADMSHQQSGGNYAVVWPAVPPRNAPSPTTMPTRAARKTAVSTHCANTAPISRRPSTPPCQHAAVVRQRRAADQHHPHHASRRRRLSHHR